MDVAGLIADPKRITLVAQPIVDTQRACVVGYETLSRFELEQRVTPDRVFAEAERQGLGAALDATVIRQALRLSQHKPVNCFLTVNVDPAHLLAPELRAVWREHPTLAGIVIELTEHRAVDDTKPLVAALDDLRARGALIAVDDAGSGYSGLRQLLELRPQLIKLDRELVSNMHEDAAKLALVQMLGELAGRLDAWLLAEGIENESELRVLQQLGVPLAQGYFLGKPTSPWSELLPDARDALHAVQRASARAGAIASLLEPCPSCSPGGEWPDAPLALRLTPQGRPLGMRFKYDEQYHERREPELMRVKASSSLAAVAERAATRTERLRWDPVVCIDEQGNFAGIVRMHRLISALARARGAISLADTLN